jgi:hypothetical protein
MSSTNLKNEIIKMKNFMFQNKSLLFNGKLKQNLMSYTYIFSISFKKIKTLKQSK